MSKDINKQLEELSHSSGRSKSELIETSVMYFIEHEGRDYENLYEVLKTIFHPLFEELKEIRSIEKELLINSYMYKTYLDYLITTDNFFSKNIYDLEFEAEEYVEKRKE